MSPSPWSALVRRPSSRLAGRLAATALALTSLAALPAYACGGFFCFTQPVDQSAERILYVQEGGKITVHIQISYTGEDQNFSWILPLQKAPEGGGLKPSSDSVFQLLEQATSPQFQLNWKNTADCSGPQQCMYASAGGGDGTNGTKGGVQVLLQQNVGPYEAVVVKGTSSTELVDWLNANKFVQPQATKPLIEQYVKENYVFLALKLQKDKSAGDLVPIAVTLDEVGPCLPIRLTALATAPDMPIVTWVVGKARAIPKNFLHVEINDAAVDWMTAGGNYKTVVSKAVDLGSGHAFLTELAKKTKDLPIQFANPGWDAKDFEKVTDPGKFLALMLEKGLPRTTQIQGLIKKYVKKPNAYKDVSDQEYFNCIQNSGSMPSEGKCKEYLDAAVKAGFDGAAFAKDLNDLVIKPLQTLDSQYKAQPYLTRLYTTLSAEEMSKDPIFGYNAELPDVSNQHSADATPVCEAGSKIATKAKLKFADGFEMTLDIPKETQGSCGNFPGSPVGFGKGTGAVVAAGGQPLKRVQVLDEKGPPLEIDQKDADKVDAQLNTAQLGTPSLKPEFIASLAKVTWNPHSSTPGTPAPADHTDHDDGCSSGRGGEVGGLALLSLALGAWWLRRRRAVSSPSIG